MFSVLPLLLPGTKLIYPPPISVFFALIDMGQYALRATAVTYKRNVMTNYQARRTKVRNHAR